MIGGYKLNLYGNTFPETAETTYDDIPLSFSSIEEAKNIFEYGHCLFTSSHAAQLSSDTLHFPAAGEALIGHFAKLFSKFSLALQAFVESKSPSFTPNEEIALAVLQLHVLNTYVSLNLEQLLPYDRPHWNQFMPQFREMVVLGEKIVSSTSPNNGHGGQATSFCSDMGYVIPLFTVASRCQDASTRRKAIALLRSTSRQEGLWNSLQIAKAAERIMEIQESASGEMQACIDGLNWARSSSIQPALELDARGGRLRYFREGEGADAQVIVVEELFSW